MYRYVNGLEKKANAARIKRKRKDKADEQTIIKNTSRFDISRLHVRFYGNENAKLRTLGEKRRN